MNDIRRFYIQHPTTGDYIVVKEGELGFDLQQGMTKELADYANGLEGNTPADLEAAEAGSMFGWGCPAAQLESKADPSDEALYDYTNQCWVKGGVVLNCGHPKTMDCQCYGRVHAGEVYRMAVDPDPDNERHYFVNE